MPRSTRTLRDEIDIRDAARRLGLDIDGHGRAHCPICGSRRKNLSIGNGMWHCFACGEAGELVKLAQVCLHTDWRGAAEWLAREYGIEAGAEKPYVNPRRGIVEIELWQRKAAENIRWARECPNLFFHGYETMLDELWDACRFWNVSEGRMPPGVKLKPDERLIEMRGELYAVRRLSDISRYLRDIAEWLEFERENALESEVLRALRGERVDTPYAEAVKTALEILTGGEVERPCGANHDDGAGPDDIGKRDREQPGGPELRAALRPEYSGSLLPLEWRRNAKLLRAKNTGARAEEGQDGISESAVNGGEGEPQERQDVVHDQV